MQSIDFVGLAAALLDRAASLVSQWLPGGHREGHEWVEARTAEGGIGDSLRIILTMGVWAYFAGDERGGDLISLYAFLHNQNNAQAARDLIEQFRWHTYLRDQTDGAPVAPAAPAARPRPAQPAADAREMSAADPDDPAAAQRWRPIVPVPAFAWRMTPLRFACSLPSSARNRVSWLAPTRGTVAKRSLMESPRSRCRALASMASLASGQSAREIH